MGSGRGSGRDKENADWEVIRLEVEVRMVKSVCEEKKENTEERTQKNAEHNTNELILSLFRLLSREKRELVLLMCESIGKCEDLTTLTGGCTMRPLKLYNISLLSCKLELSNVTLRKLVREFMEEGLVEIKVVGKSKVVLPTPKLCALCERLKGEQTGENE